LGSPCSIQEWVTLVADDARIEIALDGDAVGLDLTPFDWRAYAGETRLLAWAACHEPLIELLRAVFRCDWVPECIGDCDPPAPAPARSSSMRAGFTVLRDDGATIVKGLVNLDASASGRCAGVADVEALR